ncbi:MAG: UDP-glucuronic acid dehydrogenase [Flavobacteriaceae bacterium]|nr:UDP-glucuronic acid dehydrogenase [Flavobacteriaceae bacterium]|tara:strand:- start:67 stop:714 length:648 start_codon:yes stop_codon:yes gene_type:complete
MKIDILCSDPNHPIVSHILTWIAEQPSHQKINLLHSVKLANGGDFLFLVSCSEIISKSSIGKYKHALVLHAGDLPNGRGWSPHIWDLVEGQTHITLSLIEADEKIDCGNIWNKKRVCIPKHFLWHEINAELFEAEIEMIKWAINNSKKVRPTVQDKSLQATYRRKRKASDSEIDVNKTIAEQFDLMRVSDPSRYPAYFAIAGERFKLILERFDAE